MEDPLGLVVTSAPAIPSALRIASHECLGDNPQLGVFSSHRSSLSLICSSLPSPSLLPVLLLLLLLLLTTSPPSSAAGSVNAAAAGFTAAGLRAAPTNTDGAASAAISTIAAAVAAASSLSLAALQAGTAAPSLPSLSSYQNSLLMDESYQLFWTVDDATSRIHVAVRARTKGYIGLGISEIGAMVGSDAMVGWVSQGLVWVTDRFIFNRSAGGAGIPLDKQQDWQAVGGEEALNQSTGATWTTIHVSRLLDTGDCNDRAIPRGRAIQIIWSIGPTDDLTFHGSRKGSQSVLMWQSAGSSLPPVMPQGEVAEWYNLTMDRYKVPLAYTSYVCKKFTPNFSARKQGIMWAPVLRSSDVSTIHHMVIWSCTKEDLDKYPEGSFPCLIKECGVYMSPWAVGGLPFYFPPDVGLPFDLDNNNYLLLQIHYTNPSLKPGIIDSSGMALGFSPTPRKYNAGVIPLGPEFVTQINIPPFMPSWSLDSVCPSECTKAVMKNQSIFVFDSGLHLHTVGKQLYTTVIRDGQEIFTMNRADFYDFNYQQGNPITPAFELKPGDSLRTRCVWDSSRRPYITYGGPATYMEMCYNYIHYYPIEAANPLGYGCYQFCGTDFPPGISLKLPASWGQPGWTLNNCAGKRYNTSRTCTGKGWGRQEKLEKLVGFTNSSSPASAITTPMALPAVPAAAPTPCSLTLKVTSSQLLTFQRCAALDGGFSLLWNITSVDPAINGGNMSISLAFQAQNLTAQGKRGRSSSRGWIGLGLSPDGLMTNSDMLVAVSSLRGLNVAQYRSSSSRPPTISAGGTVSASSLSGTSTRGSVTLFATLSIPSIQASTSSHIIYSKGRVNLRRAILPHEWRDSYAATVVFAQ